MKCPFLKETQVEYCQRAMLRKMIVRTSESVNREKCSTPRYHECPVYNEAPQESAAESCPHLQDSLMQFCSAATFTKFIPYSESSLSRCGTGNFRYCDLYLALAHPELAGSASPETTDSNWVDGIRVPAQLYYAPNHMWLNVDEDGSCHIGIDALLARVLGRVDRICYASIKGVHHPTAVLTVNGIDLQLVFPNPMLVTSPNFYLRANPAKLTADPYHLGWLFEGEEPPASATITRRHIGEGLLRGDAVLPWMHREFERLNALAHQRAALRDVNDASVLADGGEFAAGLFSHMERDEALHVFSQFFSPFASW